MYVGIAGRVTMSRFTPAPSNNRVLIVSHDAFYGAPRIAVDVCRSLKRRGWRFASVLLDGGPLLGEFESLGRVVQISCAEFQRLSVENVALLEQLMRHWNPCVVYVNTVGSLAVLETAEKMGIKVVLHVHELENVLRRYCAPFQSEFLNVPSCYVAASNSVQLQLQRIFGIDASRIRVLYEGLDTGRVERLLDSARVRDIRRGAQYLVGGAGACSARKGTDVWLRVCARLRERYQDRVRFVWFGPIPALSRDEVFCRGLERKLRALALEDVVEFTGYQSNYYPLLRQVDLFTLPSREDACPLVVLDSLYLEKPVVCFDRGGAPEVVRSDAGVVVPGFDPDEMAAAAALLIENEPLRKRMGVLGRSRVEREFEIRILADEMACVFTETARAGRLSRKPMRHRAERSATKAGG